MLTEARSVTAQDSPTKTKMAFPSSLLTLDVSMNCLFYILGELVYLAYFITYYYGMYD